MPVERRGQVTDVGSEPTGNRRSPILDGRRQPSFGGTSRMTRECQVRICERLGVKLPGPTRQEPAEDPKNRAGDAGPKRHVSGNEHEKNEARIRQGEDAEIDPVAPRVVSDIQRQGNSNARHAEKQQVPGILKDARLRHSRRVVIPPPSRSQVRLGDMV